LSDVVKIAQELFPYTQTLRRDFHQHPELGFREFRTAEIVARELRALDLEVATGVAKTGVVALLEGGKPGPAILARFDMDALPVQEETGAEYASLNPGVMHACGHDGHTAIGLTVARMLAAQKDELAGTVKFVFQPAEEGVIPAESFRGMNGAEAMVSEGVLDNPKPDLTLALHLWNHKPFGWLGIAPGPVMAASEIFTITVIGEGGHGALPHHTADPIVASAQVINALQTIISRNVAPLDTAVVSVTTVHGGDAHNVIPSQVVMSGTIRTFSSETRANVLQRFHTVVEQTAAAMGCCAHSETAQLTPAVVNHPDITQRVREVARELFPDCSQPDTFQTMGSEDMAFMMQAVPGCYFFIGSADPDRKLDAPHHHPRFDFDERALARGAALMVGAIQNLARRFL
jgi:amidohydrolase